MSKKPKAQKLPRQVVTIFTDASHFPGSGASGWGATILAGSERVEHGAAFRGAVTDVLEAEVKAAACGLALARSRGLLSEQAVVVLQIDSTDAIGVILASDSRYSYSPGPHARDQVVVRGSHVPARCVEAVAAIRKVRDESGASIYLRHVKGHKPGLSGRHNLNHRADALARAAAQGNLL